MEGLMHRYALMSVLVLLAVTGCAGRDFVRPQTDSLLLSKTSEAEIRQRFGKPYREGTVVKNGQTLKALSYAYAEGGPSLAGGVVPSRGQGFYFLDGILVGHDFTSSFGEDKTDFDIAKVKQIREGQATEASVVDLLGKPHGVYLYPLVKDRSDRAVVYQYQQTRGTAFNLKFYNQLLVVTLDSNGVVKIVELTSTGER
jgi:hypothetical protein